MSKPWPQDPHGDLVPILQASIEEAKMTHPPTAEAFPEHRGEETQTLTKADRSDCCGSEALYRVSSSVTTSTLYFCHHHHGRYFPAMEAQGWKVVGRNDGLYAELYRTDQSQGSDHG